MPLSEASIMEKWYDEKPVVSVACMAYNHEKFISNCLESILEQKTNFPYEIVIHDDCSTDETTNILREYQESYPHIIKVIFSKENQYSKGISIEKIIESQCVGKYIAFCEGDDCWCDSGKLQVQYDFLEENPEYVMCVHNTIKHDILTNQDSLFQNDSISHRMMENEVFFGWNVHYSSYFIRRELFVLPELLVSWCGDYSYLLYAFYYGKIWFFSNVMSIYNYNNVTGITYITYVELNKSVEKEQLRNRLLENYNEYTNYKFDYVVSDRIKYNNIYIALSSVIGQFGYSAYSKLKRTVLDNESGLKYFDRKSYTSVKNKTRNYLLFLIYQTGNRVKNRTRL